MEPIRLWGTNKTLDDALNAYKPKLADMYRANVKRYYDYLVGTLGPSMRDPKYKIINYRTERYFEAMIRANCDDIMGSKMHLYYSGEFSHSYEQRVAYQISQEKLDKNAMAYADETIRSWKWKIEEKVGQIENASVTFLNGYAFEICGMKIGKKVRIEQNMIVNVSKLGTLFNQFPARIYVEGKFMSEAKFKKMAQAEPKPQENQGPIITPCEEPCLVCGSAAILVEPLSGINAHIKYCTNPGCRCYQKIGGHE